MTDGVIASEGKVFSFPEAVGLREVGDLGIFESSEFTAGDLEELSNSFGGTIASSVLSLVVDPRDGIGTVAVGRNGFFVSEGDAPEYGAEVTAGNEGSVGEVVASGEGDVFAFTLFFNFSPMEVFVLSGHGFKATSWGFSSLQF